MNTSSLLSFAHEEDEKVEATTVRASTFVMICFAGVFGLLAVFIANMWLNNQARQRVEVAAPTRAASTQTNGPTTTVVVTRATTEQEYTVPVEGKDGVLAGAERRQATW